MCMCLDGYMGDGGDLWRYAYFTESILNFYLPCKYEFCTKHTILIVVTITYCTNIDSRYLCMCLDGFYGDGELCEGVDLSKIIIKKWL